jgi:hypothetical protein
MVCRRALCEEARYSPTSQWTVSDFEDAVIQRPSDITGRTSE